MLYKNIGISLLIGCLLCFFSACRSSGVKKKDIVEDQAAISDYIADNMEAAIQDATEHEGLLYEQWPLSHLKPLQLFYQSSDYVPVWSDTAVFNHHAIRFINYLDTCINDGLLRDDYHYAAITQNLNTLRHDSLKMKDAVLWTQTDILMTDAFMHVIADLKQGRLVEDSMALKNRPEFLESFFQKQLQQFLSGHAADSFFTIIQPKWKGYQKLSDQIASFHAAMDTTVYTYVHYPFEKNNEDDSLLFIKSLTERLNQAAEIKVDLPARPDTQTLKKAVIQYQRQHGLDPDGKIGKQFIHSINLTDRVKFKRLLITLDRYKLLPDSIPSQYVWVNIPAFQLQAWTGDSLAVYSKIVCGKPITPTPLLESRIYDMVTYPTWTVPASIIKKEMLPGLKKSAGYLSRKGLELYNQKGEKVDPATVNWSKYKKGIPYQIKQGSGDNNALGVIKFNFKNPHDVYLHDTNQRQFFNNSMRALSHGCVRVQNWLSLATFLVRNDSLSMASQGDSLSYTPDSISSWIAAKKKQRIPLKVKVPIYINYMGCEVVDDKLVFYADIYDEDKKMIEKYFSN